MGDKELWNLVLDIGRRLRRADDLEPIYQTLINNWFDSPQALNGAAPEELASIGVPLRFAKDLIAAAAESSRGGRPHHAGDKGRGKGKGKDDGYGGGKGSKGPPRTDNSFEHIVDIESDEAYRNGYNMKRNLIGEGGRNVKHIQDQTGCSVQVEGGNGREPLSIVLRGPTQHALDKAIEQAHDLANTVNKQFQDWKDQGPSGGKGYKGKDIAKGGKGKFEPRQSSKGKDFGKDNGKGGGKGGAYSKQLDLWDADYGFQLKQKILGERTKNLHHIQDQTGAQVWVRDGDHNGPAYLEVTAPDNGSLHEAVDLCRDLLHAIREDYDKWLQEHGKGGGKRGKGKGKDRDGDPPAKRARHSY
mmetsp:Transcript_30006/g.69856  ORF Transcript_30006/g.69856 Transcript_30006/m.69856 type:complete len:358 (-) Transcript_30006:170-1243(-)